MEKPLDLRIRKTYNALTNTLIEMMEEAPFEDIRVSDLCDRAMVRKSTFYKHFADKYELLAFVVKELIRKNDEKLEKNVLKKSSFDYYKMLISEIFNFVRENERLIHSLGNSGHFIFILDALSQQITFSLKEKIEEDRRTGGFDLPASPDIMASFFVGAIGENVRNWVANGKKIPEQELKDQLCNLIKIIYSSANPNF